MAEFLSSDPAVQDAHPHTVYDLIANICHDGQPGTMSGSHSAPLLTVARSSRLQLYCKDHHLELGCLTQAVWEEGEGLATVQFMYDDYFTGAGKGTYRVHIRHQVILSV